MIRPRTPSLRLRGFTLIDAMITTIIIGVGVAATLQLLATGTNANVEGVKLTTGVNFAKCIRELSLKSTFDEVRAMDDQTFSPPVDSRGAVVANFNNWKQRINVQAVDHDCLTANVPDANPSAVRVTVTISSNNQQICNMSWYRFKPLP